MTYRRSGSAWNSFDTTGEWVAKRTVNVYALGTGPICRLDVDGTRHGEAGRSHKHALQTERCPDRNLPDGVVARADLAGRMMREVFDELCRIADISFSGALQDPGEST
jgi:hypothetical protein